MFAKWIAVMAVAAAPAWITAARADGTITEQAPPPGAPPQETSGLVTKDLAVTVGKSLIIDSPVNIQRVSVANADLADVVAISPKEVLVNGKAPGETTFIIWQQGGNRLFYDLTVHQSMFRIDAVRQELKNELSGQDVSLSYENYTAFLSGTVKDLYTADRAVAITQTLGRTVNLLHVSVPPVETQVLLRVRFADVDRSAQLALGMTLFSTGATNTQGYISPAPTASVTPSTPAAAGQAATPPSISLKGALNILAFRPDINLGVAIEALQAKNALEILAEPNVLAIDNKAASFVAGGEFPYPTLQGGGAGLGAVTIAFREFGIRLQFVPHVTPRGTIRLEVMPEVSSLDYGNALTFQGFTIPALSTRRVQTEVELENGQSFAIAGLLDNQVTESLAKVPGLANIPLLGKLFQRYSTQRNNSELLILITPEVVRPIPAGQPRPDVNWAKEIHMDGTRKDAPAQPGMNVTGPVPVKPEKDTVPVEQLMEMRKAGQPAAPQMPAVQFVPIAVPPGTTAPGSPSLNGPPQPAPAQAQAPTLGNPNTQGTTGK